MKKQQIIFKGSGRITTAAFIKNKNMRYGQIRFKGGGRINNVRITGLTEEGGGGEESGEYKDEECLGFTAVDGDVTVRLQNIGGNTPIVYYKREGQDWTLWDYSELNITEGETIRFYGENNLQFSKTSNSYSKFIMSGIGKIEASGECNSLLSKEKTKVVGSFCFYSLFNSCSNLITAPKLSSTILENYSYSQMFIRTSITVAPKLPAIVLGSYCYSSMFADTKLIETPNLPAPVVNYRSYANMFESCKLLVKVVELPATSISYGSYLSMFSGCTALTTVPNKLPAITLNDYCYNNMFKNCVSLITAPELPALLLMNYCYDSMFDGCINLNYIKAMFITNDSPYGYTRNWLKNVAATGTFVKNAAATWEGSGANGIPTGWTVETANE